jgi:hypothetical protein
MSMDTQRSIVRTRAHRILNRIPSYRDLSEQPERSAWDCDNLELSAEEQCIGRYENDPTTTLGTIIVTDLRLFVRRELGWEEIKFNEITDVTLNSEKMQATGVIISLSNGETREIPVVGRQGRFLDVFEFLRFLRRVVDDLRGFQLGRSG